MTNGKGDAPRPMDVSRETFAANYDKTFCPPLRPPVAKQTQEDWPASDPMPTTDNPEDTA